MGTLKDFPIWQRTSLAPVEAHLEGHSCKNSLGKLLPAEMPAYSVTGMPDKLSSEGSQGNSATQEGCRAGICVLLT